VIDVDCAKGGSYESLASLGVESLNWTLTARTGSGGYHFYLICSEPLKNTANRLGPFIDTRGEGDYVVAPPSYNKYGRYTWYAGTTAMQVLPEGVLARLKEPKAPSSGSLKLYSGYQAQKEKQAYAETSTPDQNITPPIQPVRAQASTAQPAARALVAPANVAQEARNNYLVSMAGRLRVHGLHANEICAMLSALNDERYGMGRHPEGPLSAEELDRTIFQSVAKWEETLGVQASTLPAVEALGSLMTRAIPEAIWLVPGLLSEGLVLLAGKPKLGKSWLALSLALTCALGSKDKGGLALGRYEVKPAGVLYLSLEDSPSRFQSRVSKLLNGRPVPENFGYALNWQPLMTTGLTDLETLLVGTPNTRMVVIDTLARVRTSSMTNSSIYQEDYALMAALHEITVRAHITLIVVHHTRKMNSDDAFDEISGGTGLTGGADISMVLKRARGQANAALHVTGRDIEEQELALNFDATTCVWNVLGSAADREISQSRRAILDLLREHGEMTPVEIAKALEKSRSTIRSLLSKLTLEQVLCKKSGCYALAPEQAESEKADPFEEETDQ
jgi:hypothetical protein